MKRKVLFITTQFPYPPYSGGKIIALQHLRFLLPHHEVDVVCKAAQQPDEDTVAAFKQDYPVGQLFIFEHWIISNRHKFKAFISFLKTFIRFKSFKIGKHYHAKTERKINELIGELSYDLIVYDQLPSLQFSSRKNNLIPTVLFTHNAEYETVLAQIKSCKNELKKRILALEVKRLETYERQVYQHIRNVIFLSSVDGEKFQEVKNPLVLPSYAEWFEPKFSTHSVRSGEIPILFMVASWSWELNRQGLLWLLDAVLPLVKSKVRLIIAGDGMDDQQKVKLQKRALIQIVGKVDEVDSYYATSHVAIIPLFGGSGIKIKVLDAMAHGIPIVTTSFGMQGLYDYTDGVSVADDAEDFANHIDALLEDEFVYLDHQKRIKKSFNKLKQLAPEDKLQTYINNILKEYNRQ